MAGQRRPDQRSPPNPQTHGDHSAGVPERSVDRHKRPPQNASAGPEQFLRDLAASKSRDGAATGSFAASELVSVVAPEIAVVYADDPERLATLTRLRPVRNGGNVVIARPYDRIVFDRSWTANDITYVSPAQLAVDCLAGPGRMPAEGEALLDWLRTRAPRWQAPSLTRSADLP